MSRTGLARVVLAVAVVVVVVLFAGRERKVWIDEATLDPYDPHLLPTSDGSPRLLPTSDGSPHLLPTPDGREHGLDDPAPRAPGLRRLPGQVLCSP